jgi:hypothetical protein
MFVSSNGILNNGTTFFSISCRQVDKLFILNPQNDIVIYLRSTIFLPFNCRPSNVVRGRWSFIRISVHGMQIVNVVLYAMYILEILETVRYLPYIYDLKKNIGIPETLT